MSSKEDENFAKTLLSVQRAIARISSNLPVDQILNDPALNMYFRVARQMKSRAIPAGYIHAILQFGPLIIENGVPG